jgi:hypothetical protein
VQNTFILFVCNADESLGTPQGLRMKNTCEDLAHVLVVPCGYFSLSAQAVP